MHVLSRRPCSNLFLRHRHGKGTHRVFSCTVTHSRKRLGYSFGGHWQTVLFGSAQQDLKADKKPHESVRCLLCYTSSVLFGTAAPRYCKEMTHYHANHWNLIYNNSSVRDWFLLSKRTSKTCKLVCSTVPGVS
jgi:hypothetical protein